MVKRTQCLYKDTIIGIETIYTVINGKQINIPDKLNDLRMKSRNNELFCPCGCGANLILVAGEHNLREQHFRIKDKDDEKTLDCRYIAEGETSINSKVILKCWLDDKLKAQDIDSRVQISDVDDTNRKYEFTFLSLSRKVGVNYIREKENITEEKLRILERNSKGIHLIHVVDIYNQNQSGQFPEFLAKIQNSQGYCLFLDPNKNDYYGSSMTAAVYGRNLDGIWEQIFLACDAIEHFEIGELGEPLYRGLYIRDLAKNALLNFDAKQNELQRQRDLEKAKWEKARKEAEERAEVQQKTFEENRKSEEEHFRKVAEENRLRKEREEAERKAAIKQKKEQNVRKWEQFNKALPTLSFSSTGIICDPDDNRLYKCSYCGKTGYEKDFYTYQGSIGICYDCDKNSQKLKEERAAKALQRQQEALPVKKADPKICPECGRRLVERNGRNGTFIGCTGYFSGCRYTRNRW